MQHGIWISQNGEPQVRDADRILAMQEETEVKLLHDRLELERQDLIKRNQELQDTIDKLMAQHNWAIENVVNSGDAEREAFSKKLMCVPLSFNTISHASKHSLALCMHSHRMF